MKLRRRQSGVGQFLVQLILGSGTDTLATVRLGLLSIGPGPACLAAMPAASSARAVFDSMTNSSASTRSTHA
jgi:hypothetical protein